MPSKIKALGQNSAGTYYTYIVNDAGEYWNNDGSAFEAYNASNWTDYALAMTQNGTSGDFMVDVPAGVDLETAQYDCEIRQQADVSPATTDTAVSGYTIGVPPGNSNTIGGQPNDGTALIHLQQLKATCNIAGEGAFHAFNAHETGSGSYNQGATGTYNEGGAVGMENVSGAGVGLRNSGTTAGNLNVASAGDGQKNEGSNTGQYNTGPVAVNNIGDDIGQQNSGATTGQLNTASSGDGQKNSGSNAGQFNAGAALAGQYNAADGAPAQYNSSSTHPGQLNESSADYGQKNTGPTAGQFNTSAAGKGQINDGATGDVVGDIDGDLAGTIDGLTASAKAHVLAEVAAGLTNYGALKPTIAGRTLDVSAAGNAGIDWANIDSPTTTQNLSGTTIGTAGAVTDKTGYSLAANQAGVTIGTVTLVTTTTSVSNGVTLATSHDVYHADIQFTRDSTGSGADRYTIGWFKNGTPLTSGITVPTIQVAKYVDGTDLIASTTPSAIGSTGLLKHNATGAARLTLGQAAIVIVTATIEGSTRTWRREIGRDKT